MTQASTPAAPTAPPSKIEGYVTAPYPCSYLPQLQARSQVAVLPPSQVQSAYDLLIQKGFRRSGGFVYSPRCDDCQACQSLRIPVAAFAPNRSQRRAAQALTTLQLARLPLQFMEEHFALYQRYQALRHDAFDAAQSPSSSPPESSSRQAYEQFLLSSPMTSELLELRSANGDLQSVSIVDWVSDGASAVYTFYDPEARGSLGTSAILWMLALTQQAKLPYLYLGYWIAQSPKMAYKARFQPAQALESGQWQTFAAQP